MQNQVNYADQQVVAEAPAGGYQSGRLAVVGDILGVACDTYAEGERAVISLCGVFGLTQVVPGEEWVEGQRLYYNEVTGLVTADPTHWPVGTAARVKEVQTAGNGYGFVRIANAERLPGQVLIPLRVGEDFTPELPVGPIDLRHFGGPAAIESCEVIGDSLAPANATIALGDGSGSNNQVLPATAVPALDGYVPVDAINDPDKLPVQLDKLVVRVGTAALTAGYLAIRATFVRVS